jgi:hypothetical protein
MRASQKTPATSWCGVVGVVVQRMLEPSWVGVPPVAATHESLLVPLDGLFPDHPKEQAELRTYLAAKTAYDHFHRMLLAQ